MAIIISQSTKIVKLYMRRLEKGKYIYVDKIINPVEAKCGVISCPS